MANTNANASYLPSLPLRLGIIGCGGILRKIYSSILSKLTDQANVVGLCDVSKASLNRAGVMFPSARCYDSIMQLLNEEKLDAVMVLSSESANACIAIQVLKAGIPVFMEKPPALTVEEYERLRAAEDCSVAPLFVAFNRRHTPFLQGFERPVAPCRIEGRMERLNREVSTFPYTALHLLDSLLYFSQATPISVNLNFKSDPVARWQLDCQLGKACRASLEIIPDGITHCEYLKFVMPDKTVEIQFPNPEGNYREGQVITTSIDGCQTLKGESGISYQEQMGYANGLRGFLKCIRLGQEAPASYRLSSCLSGIVLMEDMVNAFESQASLPHSASV